MYMSSPRHSHVIASKTRISSGYLFSHTPHRAPRSPAVFLYVFRYIFRSFFLYFFNSLFRYSFISVFMSVVPSVFMSLSLYLCISFFSYSVFLSFRLSFFRSVGMSFLISLCSYFLCAFWLYLGICLFRSFMHSFVIVSFFMAFVLFVILSSFLAFFLSFIICLFMSFVLSFFLTHSSHPNCVWATSMPTVIHSLLTIFAIVPPLYRYTHTHIHTHTRPGHRRYQAVRRRQARHHLPRR